MILIRTSTICLLMSAGLAGPAFAENYYDCQKFDDRALCKQLNEYPAVKDLPVFDTSRVIGLYRDKPDYAEELFEGRAVVLRGRIERLEAGSKALVWLGEGSDVLRLSLAPRHPVAAMSDRVGGRSAQEVLGVLKTGTHASFQCVGDELERGVPFFEDCVFWE